MLSRGVGSERRRENEKQQGEGENQIRTNLSLVGALTLFSLCLPVSLSAELGRPSVTK